MHAELVYSTVLLGIAIALSVVVESGGVLITTGVVI